MIRMQEWNSNFLEVIATGAIETIKELLTANGGVFLIRDDANVSENSYIQAEEIPTQYRDAHGNGQAFKGKPVPFKDAYIMTYPGVQTYIHVCIQIIHKSLLSCFLLGLWPSRIPVYISQLELDD